MKLSGIRKRIGLVIASDSMIAGLAFRSDQLDLHQVDQEDCQDYNPALVC